MSDLPLTTEHITTEAVGLKIIGLHDPSKLTFDEFKSSPELLYHGHSGSFKFRRNFQMRDSTVDASATLGEGFYCTDEAAVAENYSIVRGGNKIKPVATQILPFNAQVLDLRDKGNLSLNASFPRDLTTKWKDFIEPKIAERFSQEVPRSQKHLAKLYTEYLGYLKKILEIDKTFNLRQLLRTQPMQAISNQYFSSPPWVNYFRQFMLSQNIDGVIYNEGGEGHETKRNHTTYVFYNFDKVGTYDTWHS